MNSYPISTLTIGQTDYYQKTITAEDIESFSRISGDNNPVHLDDAAAIQARFKGRVAHGVLVAGLTSKVLGTQLPGLGTIYLGQQLKFVKPVYIGDTIRAVVTVAEINVDKNIVKLTTQSFNQDQQLVIEGVATVMPPKIAVVNI